MAEGGWVLWGLAAVSSWGSGWGVQSSKDTENSQGHGTSSKAGNAAVGSTVGGRKMK